jgi:hypothetical protein
MRRETVTTTRARADAPTRNDTASSRRQASHPNAVTLLACAALLSRAAPSSLRARKQRAGCRGRPWPSSLQSRAPIRRACSCTRVCAHCLRQSARVGLSVQSQMCAARTTAPSPAATRHNVPALGAIASRLFALARRLMHVMSGGRLHVLVQRRCAAPAAQLASCPCAAARRPWLARRPHPARSNARIPARAQRGARGQHHRARLAAGRYGPRGTFAGPRRAALIVPVPGRPRSALTLGVLPRAKRVGS